MYPVVLAPVEAAAMNIRKTYLTWGPRLKCIEHRDSDSDACYSIRKSNVAWDPNLVRVEYLDEKGNPFYCSIETRDNDNSRGVQNLLETKSCVSQESEDTAAQAWFGAKARLRYGLPVLTALVVALLGFVLLAAR
jgi:hypothetical protein